MAQTEVIIAARPIQGEAEYLGDAVYAAFDGFGIWLQTGDSNHQRIFLEPEVYQRLVAYAKRVGVR